MVGYQVVDVLLVAPYQAFFQHPAYLADLVEVTSPDVGIGDSPRYPQALQGLFCHPQPAGPVAERRGVVGGRQQPVAQPGQALLDILDDSTLELEFLVPSRWLSWLHAGSEFQVRIDETGKTYPAKVQRLAARVDPVSQSVKVNAAIHGKFNELIAGMSGQVLLAQPPTGKP